MGIVPQGQIPPMRHLEPTSGELRQRERNNLYYTGSSPMLYPNGRPTGAATDASPRTGMPQPRMPEPNRRLPRLPATPGNSTESGASNFLGEEGAKSSGGEASRFPGTPTPPKNKEDPSDIVST